VKLVEVTPEFFACKQPGHRVALWCTHEHIDIDACRCRQLA